MTFLTEPAPSEGQQRMYDEDVAKDGYVWDTTRVWAHHPELEDALIAGIAASSEASGLTLRERAMLVIGQAQTIGDSYCCYAWGRWLTEGDSTETAVAALRNDASAFTERELALSDWARAVAGDPNGTTPEDVQRLRDVGFDDAQILALTIYVSLRTALSATNDALGARPDQALADMLDPAIGEAITWGRQPA